MGTELLCLVNWTLFFFLIFSPRAVVQYDYFRSTAFDHFAYSSENIDNPFRSGESQPRNSDHEKENSLFDDGDIHELLLRWLGYNLCRTCRQEHTWRNKEYATEMIHSLRAFKQQYLRIHIVSQVTHLRSDSYENDTRCMTGCQTKNRKHWLKLYDDVINLVVLRNDNFHIFGLSDSSDDLMKEEVSKFSFITCGYSQDHNKVKKAALGLVGFSSTNPLQYA